jgi:ribosomal protein S18 acetylase RimI-like enzyme
MSETTYDWYLHVCVADYAEQNIISGRWSPTGALELSRREHEKLLPNGIATPNHHLFEVHASDINRVVGALWLAVEDRDGTLTGFIYDVRIYPEYRSRGYATQAFQALDELAVGMGLSTIKLHVFAHNPVAKTLYEKLGYRATGINMQKRLPAT